MMCFVLLPFSDLFMDNIGPITDDKTICSLALSVVHDAEKLDCLRSSVKHHLSASSLCLFRQFSRLLVAAPDRHMVGF